MFLLRWIRKLIGVILVFLVGLGLGAYLFHDTQPRQIIRLDDCKENCIRDDELLGLLASIGVRKTPSVIPDVIKETELTVVMKHPYPESKIHYLVVPKKDIKDIGDLTEEDRKYLVDVFDVISVIANELKLDKYRILTNGPGYQQVSYLHFHIVGNDYELPK